MTMLSIKTSALATAIFAVLAMSAMPLANAKAAASNNQVLELLDAVHATLVKMQAQAPVAEVLGASTITVSSKQELIDAILSVSGGETIALEPGDYGDLQIRNYYGARVSIDGEETLYNSPITSPVTLTSANDNDRAVLRSIHIYGADNWVIKGLSFRPVNSAKSTAIDVTAEADNVVITQNDITSGDDSNWSQADWASKARAAVHVRDSKNVEVSHNYLKNIANGIAINFGADNAVVKGNYINGFTADGIRGLGDNGLYEDNYIVNAINDGSDNHDDGFQSWRNFGNNNRGVYNITLRNNTFMYSDQSNPLASANQGIGLFDGPYIGWTIENNLVLVDHYHGISVYQGMDTTVQNNVVLDPLEGAPGPSWIFMSNHKDGTPTENSVAKNNYANRVIENENASFSGNTIIDQSDYASIFVDHENGNFKLKSGVVPFSVGATLSSKLPGEPSGSYVPPTDGGGNEQEEEEEEEDTTTATSTEEQPEEEEEEDAELRVNVIGIDQDSTISGEVFVTAVPKNFRTVRQATFWLDGKFFSRDKVAPYTMVDPDDTDVVLALDTTKMENKDYVMKVIVRGGGDKVVKQVRFTVDNEPESEEPVGDPEISVVGVSKNEVVSGNITVTAEPKNFSNVTQVAFYLNKGLMNKDRQAPYSLISSDTNQVASFDTRNLSDGRHLIQVIAKGDGKRVVERVPFTVQNGEDAFVDAVPQIKDIRKMTREEITDLIADLIALIQAQS